MIKGFSNAINKALKYTNTHSAKDIANHIISYFPNTSINDLTTIVKRYKDGDAYRNNITIS